MSVSEPLCAVFQTLIAETRARQAEALSEVTWRGRTVGVQHEKVGHQGMDCPGRDGKPFTTSSLWYT